MAKRITTAGVQVDYTPEQKKRITTAGVQVDYTPEAQRRINATGVNVEFINITSYRQVWATGIMVEYGAPEGSIYGPAVQVI